jgi:hypothetical protein
MGLRRAEIREHADHAEKADFPGSFAGITCLDQNQIFPGAFKKVCVSWIFVL